MTTPDHNFPQSVQHELTDLKQVFLNEDHVENVDPGYNRMIEGLNAAIKQHDEEREQVGSYLFNQGEFIDSLEHVVADQLSAIKKEKLPMMEVSKRFNRWITFCDAVVQLGFSCIYSKDSLQKEEYATVFGTLKLNKVFETTFLKPRGIRVALRHKSDEINNKYPWLAMPCLVVKDEDGVEHLIAITPSPEAQVWWLDILTGFHNSYNWGWMPEDDEIPVTSIDEPYAPLNDDGGNDGAIDEEFLAEINRKNDPEIATRNQIPSENMPMGKQPLPPSDPWPSTTPGGMQEDISHIVRNGFGQVKIDPPFQYPIEKPSFFQRIGKLFKSLFGK